MNRIMTHVVAGYPNEQSCLEVMKGMQQAGIEIIEVQIPFSDPIADGETIMRANDQAIEQGMTTEKSFKLIDKARKLGVNNDIYIMTYVQKMLAHGLEKFCKQASKSGVKGLIIPDLPIETVEYETIHKLAKDLGLSLVPVVSPAMGRQRLEQSINGAELIYLTSMRGITGKTLVLSKDLVEVARQIKKLNKSADLAIGFGVENSKDVAKVLKIADIAVVGSSVLRKINNDGQLEAIEFVANLVAE